jgi:hypothetical protein
MTRSSKSEWAHGAVRVWITHCASVDPVSRPSKRSSNNRNELAALRSLPFADGAQRTLHAHVQAISEALGACAKKRPRRAYAAQ